MDEHLERCQTCAGGSLAIIDPTEWPIEGSSVEDSDSQFIPSGPTIPSGLAIPNHTPDGKEYKWKDGSTLLVQFLNHSQTRQFVDHAYHQRIMEMVQTYAKEWEACTNLTFRYVDPSAEGAHIRIAFWTDAEVPQWANRDQYKGQWSLLGSVSTKSRPSMNLDFVPLLREYDGKNTTKDRRDYLLKYMKATILHEFGHALGFIHEHLREDRPFEINIEYVIKENREKWGWSEEKTRHAISNLYKMKDLQASAFDIKSIMIYSFDQKRLIQTPGKPSEVKATFELSDVDKLWASIIYPLSKRLKSAA